jgi:type I restriction enzyme R subunit
MAGSNFSFLAGTAPVLARYGALAEQYFGIEPKDCVAKLRQLCEAMAQELAARSGLYIEHGMNFIEILRSLEHSGVLRSDAADIFHRLRKTGNVATHDHSATFSHSQALHYLKITHSLAIWFHRTVTSKGDFHPGQFVPPPDPQEAEQEVKAELAELRTRLEANDQALAEARRKEEEREAALDEIRSRFDTAVEEREIYAQLAQEAENRLVEEQRAFTEKLAVTLRQAESAGPAQREEFIAAAHNSDRIELDEADTRRLIDAQLEEFGWLADSTTRTYKLGARPAKGVNQAIAEWPTESGPVDYVLFHGLQPLAVVEAKRFDTDVSTVVSDQAARYAQTLRFERDAQPAGGPWGDYRVPFLFATNGRPFLEQLRTKSGIWFRDARRPQNQARPLTVWYSPSDLAKELEKDVDDAHQRLAHEPFGNLGLRDYQVEAVQAAERAIEDGQRRVLLAMATGTGKTRTCIGLIYRLIKSGRFRRVLFLVDRTSLGEQALGAFKHVQLDQMRSLTEIYDVKELGDLTPDADTRVHVATVQGMVRRVLLPSEDDPPIPAGRYDCVVVDECHRGYTLDRDLSDAEFEYRDERHYLSQYRRVIDSFDAVTIGLTATPALHTTEIFNPPAYQYTYRQAVVDGWLIDHEPPITYSTKLSREGIHWAAGDDVPVFQPAQGQMELFRTPDELDFDVEQFNRLVVTENFNRVICAELAREIDPDLPGKTLVFAANDHHADMLVQLLKEAFAAQYGELDDGAVAKITSKADRPLELIRRFKNERDPRIVVTVNLLTTGIDVPEITGLVFMRRVRSRILYEQMLGRATRRCDDIGKTAFRIFDAVGIYEALEQVSTMKPVVKQPHTTFRELVEAMATAESPEARADAHQQFVAKLQARKHNLDTKRADDVQHHAGEDAESLTKRLRGLTAEEAGIYLAERPGLVAFLDSARAGGPHRLYVANHEDGDVEMHRGWGKFDRPEDYLEAFGDWIDTHLNEIPALIAVTQRPRDLTRAQLRELRLALDKDGFSEKVVAEAMTTATQQTIASSIIGLIRAQALGSPLEPYADRVQRALGRVLANHPELTRPQRTWLERIAKQIQKEYVVDREVLDAGEFKHKGGYHRLNKVFNNRIDDILGELHESIWEDAG